MNIKSLFIFEQKENKQIRIKTSENFFQTMFDILTGKKTKFMGDLAKSFGLYLKRLNLEKSDPLIINLFCLIRKLQMLKPADRVKSLIYARVKINALISRNKSEEADILNLLFETSYQIIFKTNSREEIISRTAVFCSLFEEILMYMY